MMQANVQSEKLQSMCQSFGIDRLPYFQLYKGFEVVSAFAASLSKINKLRVEIALHKGDGKGSEELTFAVKCLQSQI